MMKFIERLHLKLMALMMSVGFIVIKPLRHIIV